MSETGCRDGARPPAPKLLLLLKHGKGCEDVLEQAGGQDARPIRPDVAQLTAQGIGGGSKRRLEELHQGAAKKAGGCFPGQFPVEFSQRLPVRADPPEGGIVEELGHVRSGRVVGLDRQKEKLDEGETAILRTVRTLQKLPEGGSPEDGGWGEEAGEVLQHRRESRWCHPARTCYDLVHAHGTLPQLQVAAGDEAENRVEQGQQVELPGAGLVAWSFALQSCGQHPQGIKRRRADLEHVGSQFIAFPGLGGNLDGQGKIPVQFFFQRSHVVPT